MGPSEALKTLGADAVSAYSVQRKAVGGIPFEQGIAAPEREFWAKNAEAGVKIVPPITAGGDSRPRLEWPMPWGRRLQQHSPDLEPEHDGSGSAKDFSSASSVAGEPFCAVATQAKRPP